MDRTIATDFHVSHTDQNHRLVKCLICVICENLWLTLSGHDKLKFVGHLGRLVNG